MESVKSHVELEDNSIISLISCFSMWFHHVLVVPTEVLHTGSEFGQSRSRDGVVILMSSIAGVEEASIWDKRERKLGNRVAEAWNGTCCYWTHAGTQRPRQRLARPLFWSNVGIFCTDILCDVSSMWCVHASEPFSMYLWIWTVKGALLAITKWTHLTLPSTVSIWCSLLCDLWTWLVSRDSSDHGSK